MHLNPDLANRKYPVCVVCSCQMSDDDATATSPDSTRALESRGSGLSNQQRRQKVASSNAEEVRVDKSKITSVTHLNTE